MSKSSGAGTSASQDMPQQLTASSIATFTDKIDFGVLNVSPEVLAKAFQQYVAFGSTTRSISYTQITVFPNADHHFEGKEEEKVVTTTEGPVAQTIHGLMAAGAKFLDAAFYMMSPIDKRPLPKQHAKAKGTPKGASWPLFNDQKLIAQYMFVYYFYIMIRARCLYTSGDRVKEPIPKFITTVLGITASEVEMGNYLATFGLHGVDPRWVTSFTIKGLSQEALSRLGLGVAGYRLTTPFKTYEPDRMVVRKSKGKKASSDIEEEDEELAIDQLNLRDAFHVAQSFAKADACWDFHPATRSPAVLKKYGNINKNLGNLILDIYSDETIHKMQQQKILYQTPDRSDLCVEYMMWTRGMAYQTTKPIFPK